ncbi:Nitric oxide synthase-interacting protein [Ceratocystis lukuohia]|uniref:Nitric oxide synthase-interacting protein n=2 Tax=Ceratocystis TaxID=5157 RepID=A0A0F8B3N5_CERFI|nr:Nitric oxide synthase-interacting protein [Ceratocystis platani]
MSHSKRNTSRPVFTAHERSIARAAWSSSSARLSRDSFLPFGSCILCLEAARDPVCCTHGDILCRECALANVLAQKKEIKRAAKIQERAAEEISRGLREREEKEKEREVKEWERVQAGLENSAPAIRPDVTQKLAQEKGVKPPLLLLENGPASRNSVPSDANESRGTKRKLLEPEAVAAASDINRTKTQRLLASEAAAAPVLPSFWTPSLTPSVDSNVILAGKKIKAGPVCPASKSDHEHGISAKHLITLKFTGEGGQEWVEDKEKTSSVSDPKKPRWFCPSCVKPLTNSSGAILAKDCGHVFCKGCTMMLISTSSKSKAAGSPDEEVPRCYICSSSLAGEGGKKHGLPAGLVSLKTEGTGFSARGQSKVQRSTTDFNV